MSQYVGPLVASRMQTRTLDCFFACLAVPNERVTVARRCPGPEVHVIGSLARSLGLLGGLRARRRRRSESVGCGYSRRNLGPFGGFFAGCRCPSERIGRPDCPGNMGLLLLTSRV